MPCHQTTTRRVPRHTANHEHTSHILARRWMRARARFSRRAHLSPILVHVGVDQRCRAHQTDKESPTLLPAMSTHDAFQRERWMGAQARFNRHKHTLIASFSYTLVSVSVAMPCSMRMPAPCRETKRDDPNVTRTSRAWSRVDSMASEKTHPIRQRHACVGSMLWRDSSHIRQPLP